MNIIKQFFAGFILFSLMACSPSVEDDNLPPERSYHSGFSLLPPSEPGWLFQERNSHSLILSKYGSKTDETYGIQTIVDDLPPLSNQNDFLNFLKERHNKGSDPRFKLIEYEISPNLDLHSSLEKYCVQSSLIFEDNKPVTKSGGIGRMVIETHVLSCRHPSDEKVLIEAVYSHRHYPDQEDPNLARKAEEVFNSVQFSSFYESSPLIVSIRLEDVEDVKSLIDSGADVNALSEDLINKRAWMLTPLIRASMTGNIEIIKMLLDAGADINAKDEWGDTALMATAAYDHAEAAKLLIKYGADVNATKSDLTTALMIAARKGNLNIIKILLSANADVNLETEGGGTALFFAALRGNKSIMEALIKNGANVNQRDNKNRPLLSKFMKQDQTAVAKLLIISGADINARHGGGTPLMAAAYIGNTELIRILLKHGADIAIKYKSNDNRTNNSTALHFAAIRGHTDTVKALIEAGCDIDAQTEDGCTALRLAVTGGHTKTEKVLLNAGADSNLK